MEWRQGRTSNVCNSWEIVSCMWQKVLTPGSGSVSVIDFSSSRGSGWLEKNNKYYDCLAGVTGWGVRVHITWLNTWGSFQDADITDDREETPTRKWERQLTGAVFHPDGLALESLDPEDVLGCATIFWKYNRPNIDAPDLFWRSWSGSIAKNRGSDLDLQGHAIEIRQFTNTIGFFDLENKPMDNFRKSIVRL